MSHDLAEQVVDSAVVSEVISQAVKVLTADEFTTRDLPGKVQNQLVMYAFRMALLVCELPTSQLDTTRANWREILHKETGNLFDKQPFKELYDKAIGSVQQRGVVVDFPSLLNQVSCVLIVTGSAVRLKKSGLDLALLSS